MFFRRVVDYFTPTKDTFKNPALKSGLALGTFGGLLYGVLNHEANVSCRFGAYVYENAAKFLCVFVGKQNDLCEHTGEDDTVYHWSIKNCNDSQQTRLFNAAYSAIDSSWSSDEINAILMAIPIAQLLFSFAAVKMFPVRSQTSQAQEEHKDLLSPDSEADSPTEIIIKQEDREDDQKTPLLNKSAFKINRFEVKPTQVKKSTKWDFWDIRDDTRVFIAKEREKQDSIPLKIPPKKTI